MYYYHSSNQIYKLNFTPIQLCNSNQMSLSAIKMKFYSYILSEVCIFFVRWGGGVFEYWCIYIVAVTVGLCC